MWPRLISRGRYDPTQTTRETLKLQWANEAKLEDRAALTRCCDDRGQHMDSTHELSELLHRLDCQGASDHAHAAWIELATARFKTRFASTARCQLQRFHSIEAAITCFEMPSSKHGVTNVHLGAVLNRCQQRRCDSQRRQCRQQHLSQRDFESVHGRHTVEGDVLSNERQEVVNFEVDRLPTNMATVIRRCMLNGESIARVARDLNCPQGTIKSWIHRGKDLLRESSRLKSLAD
jgi:hypothetical protein